MNLNLRKAVAEANGCKAVIRTINDLAGIDNTYLFCECKGEKRFNSHSEWVNGKFLIKPYDLDHHAAIDALMEFREKRKYRFKLADSGEPYAIRYICQIMIDPKDDTKYFVGGSFNLAVAICNAIVNTFQKSEKKEKIKT